MLFRYCGPWEPFLLYGKSSHCHVVLLRATKNRYFKEYMGSSLSRELYAASLLWRYGNALRSDRCLKHVWNTPTSWQTAVCQCELKPVQRVCITSFHYGQWCKQALCYEREASAFNTWGSWMHALWWVRVGKLYFRLTFFLEEWESSIFTSWFGPHVCWGIVAASILGITVKLADEFDKGVPFFKLYQIAPLPLYQGSLLCGHFRPNWEHIMCKHVKFWGI